jgi:hypothetical protein
LPIGSQMVKLKICYQWGLILPFKRSEL